MFEYAETQQWDVSVARIKIRTVFEMLTKTWNSFEHVKCGAGMDDWFDFKSSTGSKISLKVCLGVPRTLCVMNEKLERHLTIHSSFHDSAVEANFPVMPCHVRCKRTVWERKSFAKVDQQFQLPVEGVVYEADLFMATSFQKAKLVGTSAVLRREKDCQHGLWLEKHILGFELAR